MTIEALGRRAKEASHLLATLSTSEKNSALHAAADLLDANIDRVLAANEKDVDRAVDEGTPEAVVDRLRLTPGRSSTGSGSASQMPTRRWNRRIDRGAHQLARPARRMKAGTRVSRMRNASTRMARASPTPSTLTTVTPDVANAA